jgi:hypothetical protein
LNILVTASRAFTGDHLGLFVAALNPYDREKDFLIHGGAKGGDKLAHLAWRQLGFVNDPHVVRPEYDYWFTKIGRAGFKVAPTKRNQLMVDGKLTEEGPVDPSLVPETVLAFYLTETPSGGTLDCATRARKAGIEVLDYFWPLD